ncbi:MAG TPA: hypothetical protein VHW46_02170 [Terracidiphilus sp.]|jgi:hypothetical protein|nr:hypothetical protein [Terracidiphilus sp.]
METHLRPLTLGEILDRTAELYRTHFLLLAGIASVYAAVLLVLSLLQIGVQETLRANHMNAQIIWATLAGALLMVPVILIAGGFAIAANNRAVSWVHLGQPATIRAAYRSIVPRLGRYLWLMVMTAFLIWIPFGVLYGGYMVFVLLYARPKGLFVQGAAPRDPAALIVFGLVTLAFALLALAAVVYAVFMGLRYSLAVPACVIEDIPARKALRRSVDLSSGSRGRIFLLALLVVAVQVGLGLITQLFFIVATFRHHGQLPAGIRVLQQLVAFCTNTFVGPIYATGFTLFYYDQRVRKEGFDIEWMMQAAGMSPAAAERENLPVALSTPAVSKPAETGILPSSPARASGPASEDRTV